MASQLLQITNQNGGTIRMSPDDKESASVEIPSEYIRAGQLNRLLRSMFPAGGYNVDV